MLRQTLWLIVAKCGIVLTMCIRDIPMNTILTTNTTKAIANNIIVIIFLKPFFKFVIYSIFSACKGTAFSAEYAILMKQLCNTCEFLDIHQPDSTPLP